jgi:hypothetical protein
MSFNDGNGYDSSYTAGKAIAKISADSSLSEGNR